MLLLFHFPEQLFDRDVQHLGKAVESGESLALIADKYGTTYSILAEHNNIEDPRVIQPGQEIRIPTEQTE